MMVVGKITRQAVTKHLQVLERAGVVARKPVGRECRFGMVPEPLNSLRQYLDSVSMQWDDALSRLKNFVET